MQAEQEKTYVVDGMIWNEDGECLGVWEKPSFHVDTQEKAEWLMEKLSGYDAEVLALDARLKALSENLGKMKADVQRKRDGLAYKYGPELEKFAKDNLPAGKKTWVCPYGSVAFRASHGGVRVVDDRLALEMAQKSGWANAIKVSEEFRVSQLTEAQTLEIKNFYAPENDMGRAFKIVEPSELASVKTGVKD